MLKLEKKQIKLVSLTIVVFFVLGVVGLALSQSGKTSVASASSSSNIGVVNNQQLVSQHPDMAEAQKTMQAEVEQAKKDFETKTANMQNDKEKQDYYTQTQQRLSDKQQSLVNPIIDKVNAAIKAVAEAKGLAVVMDASNVVYGGQDITEEVSKKITGK